MGQKRKNGRTEKELADFISKRLNLPIRTGRKFLEMLLGLIREDLGKIGRSELRGLGTFTVHDRPGRDTIHPKTKLPVHIPDRKAIRYRAAKAVKELINLPPPEPPTTSKAKGQRRKVVTEKVIETDSSESLPKWR